MGNEERVNNALQDTKGKVKEGVGAATDNEQLEAEGKMDQAKATVKDKVEDVKDSAARAFNNATDDDHR